MDLMDTAIEKAVASLSPNTRRCYVNQYLDFLKFIKSKFPNDNLFPTCTRNAHVITYLAHLCMLDYAPATLLVKVSAIACIHKLSLFPDPCDCFLIKHMLTGAKKLKCKPMFLLAFHAFLRVGEITQHKTEDHNFSILI